MAVLACGGGDARVYQTRCVLSVVGHGDYLRTGHGQLPELGQVVDEGVQDHRYDEVARAVFVPERISVCTTMCIIYICF